MKYYSQVASYAVSNPSAIREIMNIVTDYETRPEKYPRRLIYFGGGWPQDPPPREVRAALYEIVKNKELFIKCSRYGATRGQPYFINTITEYEREVFGRSVTSNEILVGLGSTELTASIIKALIDPGDNVILTRPSYLNYKRQLIIESQLGIKLSYWNVIKRGKFSPNLEELKSIIKPNTRLIILTSPGNPDSQIIPDEVIEGVIDLAEDHGFWVLIDLAYRGFIYTKKPKYLLRSRRSREIIVVSFSKELRIPGWRLAYMIADEEIIKAVETMEQATTLCPSRLAQEVLYLALRTKERIKSIKAFIERRSKYYAKIGKLAHDLLLNSAPRLKALKPQGGFYVFFNHTHYLKSSKEFCNRLLKEWQVALAPGKDFGMDGWSRLSFAPLVLDKDQLKEGIERIGKFLNSLR